MMRSKRHRARSPIQWLVQHPFLTLAILAGLVRAAMWLGIGSEHLLERAWLVLGYGFHVADNLLSSVLPDLSGWLELALIAVIGLTFYLLLDAVWQRLRPE